MVGFYDNANWINVGGANKAASVDPLNPIAHDDLTSYLQIFRTNTNKISFFLTGIRPEIASVLSVTLWSRWRNINNYNPAQTLNFFTRRLGTDSTDVVLTGGGDGVGNFTTLSVAMPTAPDGSPWAPLHVLDIGLELGMYPASWQALNPNEIDPTSAWLDVSYEPLPQQIGQARETASRRLWMFRRANPMLDTPAPLDFIDAETGDEVAVSDYGLPLHLALGAGSKRWQRPLFRKVKEQLDLNTFQYATTLKDIRAQLVTFMDMGRSLKTGGPTADGVARLDVGCTRLWTRASHAWVPDPSDGIVRELQDGQEKMGTDGMLFERASTLGLSRTSFISQLTGWGTTTDVTAEPAVDNQPLFEPGVTSYVAKITSNAGGVRGPTSSNSISYTANTIVSVSVDYREGESDTALKIRIARSFDGRFWDGSAWQVAAQDLAVTPTTGHGRAKFENIDVGANATRITVRPVILAVAAKTAYVYHAQIEAQAWASESRMVADSAASFARPIDVLTISNNTGVRCWPNAVGSGLFEYVPKWNISAARSTDLFYFFDLVYDANNRFRLYYRQNTAELVFEVKRAGVAIEAVKSWTPTRDVATLLGYRWTSIEGEHNLAAYTASVFVAGVKGTDAVSAGGMPIEASPSSMYIGADSTGTWSADGVQRYIVKTQQALLDAEMGRGQ